MGTACPRIATDPGVFFLWHGPRRANGGEGIEPFGRLGSGIVWGHAGSVAEAVRSADFDFSTAMTPARTSAVPAMVWIVSFSPANMLPRITAITGFTYA